MYLSTHQAVCFLTLVTSLLTLAFGWPFLLVVAAYLYWMSRDSAVLGQQRGRSVLITGCDSGFGHILASRLAGSGCVVFAGCLFPEGQGACSLKQLDLPNLHVLPLDVTNPHHVTECLRTTEPHVQCDGLWGLVNNAGVAVQGDFELNTVDQMTKQLDVNLLGAIRMTKAFLPHLRRAKGRLVNVTSVKGSLSLPFNASYCASKAGLDALTDVLRMELKRSNIKVIAVQPCDFGGATQITKTEKMQRDFEEMWSHLDKRSREFYGKQYLDAHVALLAGALDRSCFDLTRVTSAITEALFAHEPRARYLVAGGKQKVDPLVIQAVISPILPEVIRDKWNDNIFKNFKPISIMDSVVG